MKTFKVEVSKGLEKYNIIRKSENESLLKEQLHKEGFSILSIKLIENIEELSGNKFYFEFLEKDGSLKIGTIISDDIFKAYLKIKYELKYQLKYIYQNKNSTIEEKENIINNLEEQYKIYLDVNKKKIEKQKQEELSKIKVTKEVSIDSFSMKKELDEIYKIIDKVLEKLRYFLSLQDSKYLNQEKKQELNEIYNIILQLKNSTNIVKLKKIAELALVKMGEIELNILEDKKNEELRNILKQTNKLLKEVGSKQNFIEKDKDISYILKNFFNDIKKFFNNIKNKKTKDTEIDKTSNIYLKTSLLYNKYEEKLKELNLNILKNFFIFLIPTKNNLEKKQDFILRKKILKQNLNILKSRLTGKTFSYVKIIKGYNYFVNIIIKILKLFENPIFLFVILYDFIFLTLIFLYYFGILTINFNFYGLFYFILINLIFILLQFTKGLFSLIFNIVFFIFIFILGVINF